MPAREGQGGQEEIEYRYVTLRAARREIRRSIKPNLTQAPVLGRTGLDPRQGSVGETVQDCSEEEEIREEIKQVFRRFRGRPDPDGVPGKA